MKNKKVILIIVLIGILSIIGVSYAIFSYTSIGENQQLIVGDIWMKYTENNQLILEDAMPTDFNNYLKYKPNPIMKTQELEETTN